MAFTDKTREREYKREWYRANRARLLAAAGARRRANPDYMKLWRAIHQEEVATYNAAYAKEHRSKLSERRRVTGMGAAARARYRKLIREGTPYIFDDAFNRHMVAVKYAAAKIVQRHFPREGGWHVDHIHPVKGPAFLGHIYQNLQLLPGRVNLSKSNRDDSVILAKGVR